MSRHSHSPLDRIERKLDLIIGELRIMAAELDALETQVEQNTSAEKSAITLLNGLSKLIADSKGDPAKLQKLADDLKSSAADLSAAILANTPAAPTP